MKRTSSFLNIFKVSHEENGKAYTHIFSLQVFLFKFFLLCLPILHWYVRTKSLSYTIFISGIIFVMAFFVYLYFFNNKLETKIGISSIEFKKAFFISFYLVPILFSAILFFFDVYVSFFFLFFSYFVLRVSSIIYIKIRIRLNSLYEIKLINFVNTCKPQVIHVTRK